MIFRLKEHNQLFEMEESYLHKALDKNLRDYLARNVYQRIIYALGLSLLIALVSALYVFVLFSNVLIALGVFVVVAVVSINLSFIKMVPSDAENSRSHTLIIAVAQNPSRVNDFRHGIYSVLLDGGEIYEFNRVEQRAWNYLVVPFLCKMHSKLSANKKQERSDTLTRSELRQLNEDKNALKVATDRIEKDRLELNATRLRLLNFQRRLADQEQIHFELARNHTEQH